MEAETTDTVSQETIQSTETTDTVETTQETDHLASVLDSAFPQPDGFSGIATSEKPSNPTEVVTEETEATSEVQEETTDTTEQTETTEANTTDTDTSYLLGIKVGDVEKSWDLRDEEQRKQVINKLQQSEHADNKFLEVNKIKEESQMLLDQQKQYYTANLNKYLYNVMQGKVQVSRPVYDDYIGKTDSEEGDRAMFQQDDNNYLATQKAAIGFESGYKNASDSFSKMISTFGVSHPDIPEPVKWISEKVQPYYDALESFGMKPFPDDTAEMLYWWTNKSKLEETVREDERKKLAKIKPKTTVQTSKVNVTEKPKSTNPIDEMLDAAYGEVKGFKLR